MSNFVHKVKDAITDHDKPVTRSQTQTSDERTHNAGNPFTSNYNNRQNAPAPRMDNPVNTGPGRNVNRPDDGTGSLAPNLKTQGTCSQTSIISLRYHILNPWNKQIMSTQTIQRVPQQRASPVPTIATLPPRCLEILPRVLVPPT